MAKIKKICPICKGDLHFLDDNYVYKPCVCNNGFITTEEDADENYDYAEEVEYYRLENYRIIKYVNELIDLLNSNIKTINSQILEIEDYNVKKNYLTLASNYRSIVVYLEHVAKEE